METRAEILEALENVITQLNGKDGRQADVASILCAVQGALLGNEINDLSEWVSVWTRTAIYRIHDKQHQPKHEETGMNWLFGARDK